MREWIDNLTGRTVRQLTDFPEGALVDYFRFPRRLPDGSILARRSGETQMWIAIDIHSGAIESLESVRGRPIRLRESDGRLWFVQPKPDRTIWVVDWPHGTPRAIGEIPESWEPRELDITCDGKTVVAILGEVDTSREYSPPNTRDPKVFWEWCSRPRRGCVQALDLETGREHTIVETEGLLPTHIDTSPIDPNFMKFAHDAYDGHNQRVWAVQIDGGELRKIRPQERGEMVTHEFWWPDGQSIAYKHQDRRNDQTVEDLPWSEYSPIPTQFGLSNLAGEEYYLSDPINHYHTHINVSPDGTRLSGEGTDGRNFVYAAAFSTASTRIDFIPHAAIHTPYIPFRGQFVDAGFSHDGEWIIYNDTIDGVLQVCAVKVEV